ncbi:lambda exonuclease family protein [Roseiconus lacunae]|uniref:lambda exonuclease family protein n=1 Tax=Roseiconus lacunae TaxID=2605694 RepID=UPI001E35D6DA|nr:lambda exonuclease family protein [Roseiconus lacunae]MCD0460031.1 YqaJ viral recombinase family protein [Roseiconus lacunae]
MQGIESLAALGTLEVADEVVNPRDEAEAEWLAKRRGKITGSRFGEIIGTGRDDNEFTNAGYKYLRLVVAERLGSYEIGFRAASTDWGNEYEPLAIAEYAEREGIEIDSGEFCFREYSKDVGATPDLIRIDGNPGECKCPKDPAVHIETAISEKVPPEYVWQCHGHILVTEGDFCDFMSFDPRIKPGQGPRLVVVRVNRDEKKLDYLRKRLDQAVEWVELVTNMLKRG